MDRFVDTTEMLRALAPDQPVYCVYPHVYRDSTRRFLAGFPGRVLYAVKANNEPIVLQAMLAAGLRHFDCASLVVLE